MNHAHRIATLLVFAISTMEGVAQTAQPAAAPAPMVGSIAGHPGWPVAKTEDVSSPEAIVAAVYNVISGSKGQPRDWDRMRSLFVPDARLIPASSVPPAGSSTNNHTDAIIFTIDGYIARSGARLTSVGFFEHSIHNEIEQFGNIVQIWSTYESRHNADDPTPFARGINSFQLLKDGDRYWVVNIFWDSESPSHPIPLKYLPK